MITGVVTSNKEAVIPILVRGSLAQEAEVEAVIDTGFTGFLTLPGRLITNLALPFAGTTRATLGDSSEVQMEAFEATVLLDNQDRSIVVLAANSGTFLGMAMLSGYRLTIDVKGGGSVIIEALP